MRIDDMASDLEQQQREAALRHRKPQLTPCWRGHNCGAAVLSELLFCDVDCRDDFEKRERARRA